VRTKELNVECWEGGLRGFVMQSRGDDELEM
jgi:hypothetical protein